MNESDVKDIFLASDLVRDNMLSENEFVVSLAVSYLLGLINNFDHISKSLVALAEAGVGSAGHMSGHLSNRSARESLSNRSSARGSDGDLTATVSTPALISKALQLMVEAYMLFDKDGSGTIQVNEVQSVMRQHHETSTKSPLTRRSSGTMSQAIRNERIKELDMDRDGTITFQEFVLTFQKWVD